MDSKGLSNDDFRQIMMTPRTTSDKSINKISNDDNKMKKKNMKMKYQRNNKDKKSTKTKPQELFDGDNLEGDDDDHKLEQIKSKYRNRAEERRLGKTTFSDQLDAISSVYETISADNLIKSMNDNGIDLQSLIHDVDVLDDQIDMKNDIDINMPPGIHLKPMLDSERLSILNNSLEQKSKSSIGQIFTTSGGESLLTNTPGTKNQRVNSIFAKNIATVINSITHVGTSTKTTLDDNLFKTGRIAYEFQIENKNLNCLESECSYIPTIIIRSKTGYTRKNEKSLTTTRSIIDKLFNILAYLRHDSSRQPIKPQSNKTNVMSTIVLPPIVKSSQLCDSIYDEVGEYNLEDNLQSAQRLKQQQNITKNIVTIENKSTQELDSASSNIVKNNHPLSDLSFADSNTMKRLASEARDAKYKSKIKDQESCYLECYPKNYINTNEEHINRLIKESDSETKKNNVTNHATSSTKGSQTERKNYSGSKSVRDSNRGRQKLDSEWSQISKLIEKRKHGDVGDVIEEEDDNQKKIKLDSKDNPITSHKPRRRLI